MPFVHSVWHKPDCFMPYVLARRELGQELNRDSVVVYQRNVDDSFTVRGFLLGEQHERVVYVKSYPLSEAIRHADKFAKQEAMR